MINSIILGDSIDVIKSISDCFVHAIISDIPYGICYGEWDVLHNNTNTALGGGFMLGFLTGCGLTISVVSG